MIFYHSLENCKMHNFKVECYNWLLRQLIKLKLTVWVLLQKGQNKIFGEVIFYQEILVNYRGIKL